MYRLVWIIEERGSIEATYEKLALIVQEKEENDFRCGRYKYATLVLVETARAPFMCTIISFKADLIEIATLFRLKS
jgi:hypothetical protein